MIPGLLILVVFAVAAGLMFTRRMAALLALPAIGIGLAGQSRAAGGDRAAPRAQARGALAWLADACLMAAALFVIAWLAVFGSEYHKLGESPGVFTTQAVHPIADILALGALLALAVRAGRAGLTPYLALFVVAVGESLAVGARIGGMRPGAWSVVIQLAGFCLLGVSALAREPGEATSRWRPGWPRPDVLPGATLLAALVAGVAAAMTIGWALAGESFAEPAVLASGGVAALALVARVTELLRQERTAAAMSQESEQRFRELAGRTSDVVLICDRDGVIRYASPAVCDYGYTPAELADRSLSELIHPEDRASGVRIVRGARSGPHPGRFPCRVRSSDGLS